MNLRLLTRLLALTAVLLHCAQLHAAEDKRNLTTNQGGPKRIALVIGNSDYQHVDILPKLKNPVHDAEDIASTLRRFGFEVIEKRNLTLEQMQETVAQFGSRIGGSDAALFYFAGHGLQVKNQNYLMPVNAKVDSESAVPYQGLNVNQVLDEMDNAKSAINIVMLDACRNNPISGKFRTGKTRGLAAPESTPKGTVIVYATDPGNTAADGEGRNGLFTAGFLSALRGNDLTLGSVLFSASDYVERESLKLDATRKQTPYVNGPETLKRQFSFGTADKTQLKQISSGSGATARTPDQIEDELWDAIKDSNKTRVFDEYIKTNPNGRYLQQAKLKLYILQSEIPTQQKADYEAGNHLKESPSPVFPQTQFAQARINSQKCTTADVPGHGFFEIETNPENKSIEVRIVSKHTGAFGYTFNMTGNAANLHGIIQKGRQLSVTINPANLNSMTALASLEPNYDGINSIPAGVTRVMLLSKIPKWFDFTSPAQGAVWRGVSFSCTN